MKYKIIFLFTLLSTLTSFSQTRFESESDVLFYLNSRSFYNKEYNVKMTFYDMASQMRTGSQGYYQPEVTIMSSTKAIVKYINLSDPEKSGSFMVDLNENALFDRNDNTRFDSTSDNNNSQNPVRKPKVVKKKKK